MENTLGTSEKFPKFGTIAQPQPPVNTMSQLTFAEAEYAIKKRTTRREKFLARLEELVPWQKLKQQLSKGYQKTGPGRPPYPLESMLRIHIMQLVYNLSDPEMEDYLYETALSLPYSCCAVSVW